MSATSLSIGIVTASISRCAGGLFDAVRSSARALAIAGNNISVFSLSDERTEHDFSAWAPLAPRLFRRRGPRVFAYAPQLSEALTVDGPDVVHQHGLWLYPSIAVSRFHDSTGRPTLISPHGMLDPWALRNSAWKKRIARTFFEDRNLCSAACLHALNDSEAASMRAFGLGNPIAVIANGVAVPNLGGERPPRPACFGSDDRRVLLFLGRVHPKKGLAETLDAWALLKRTAPDVIRAWRLVIAGWDDGDHLIGLSKRANDLGIANDVTFPGPLFGSQKEAAFHHADAFILASHSEGLPMAILEAWAYQLPVFMTRACNLPEGFAAEAAVEISTEPASMASTLEGRLNDKGIATLGNAGRALVEARFTWDAIVSEQTQVYEWLVRGAPRPACVRVQ